MGNQLTDGLYALALTQVEAICQMVAAIFTDRDLPISFKEREDLQKAVTNAFLLVERGFDREKQGMLEAMGTVLLLGYAVRSLDPAGHHGEIWTNDGEYIPGSKEWDDALQQSLQMGVVPRHCDLKSEVFDETESEQFWMAVQDQVKEAAFKD